MGYLLGWGISPQWGVSPSIKLYLPVKTAKRYEVFLLIIYYVNR
jgi:hypothetical protein